MLGTAQSLSDDPVVLQGLITQLTEQLAEAQRARAEHAQRIEQLLDYIALLQRKRFGPSADRIPDKQLALFDEAELETLIAELEAQLPAATPPSEPTDPTGADGSAAPKRQPVRRPLPANLPRVERIPDRDQGSARSREGRHGRELDLHRL